MPRLWQKATQLLPRRSPARNSKRRKQRPPRKTREVTQKLRAHPKRLLKKLGHMSSTLGPLKSLQN